MDDKKPVRTFHDLAVYQAAYQAMLEVFKHVLPRLPAEEKYDLTDQLRRSTKAVPRLIAEGHAKRHQKRGFQKYLDDAMAESSKTMVSLTQAKDLYPSCVDVELCLRLIDTYDKISRQCYKLGLAWDGFGGRDPQASRETLERTPDATERRNELRNRNRRT
jgi:four helix bundle protein